MPIAPLKPSEAKLSASHLSLNYSLSVVQFSLPSWMKRLEG